MLKAILLTFCFLTLISCSSSNSPDEIPADLSGEISDLEDDIFETEEDADGLESEISEDELELDGEFDDPDTVEVSSSEEGITEEELDFSDELDDELDDSEISENELGDFDDSEIIEDDLNTDTGLEESFSDLGDDDFDLDEGVELSENDSELADDFEDELDLEGEDSSEKLDETVASDNFDESELDFEEDFEVAESGVDTFDDLDESKLDSSEDSLDLDGLDESFDTASEDIDIEIPADVSNDELSFGDDFEDVSVGESDLLIGDDQVPSSSNNDLLIDPSISNKVLSLDYDSSKEGGVFIVKTKTPSSYSTEFIPETNQFIVELQDTKIDSSLQRPFLTKDFKQNFGALNSYQGSDGEAKLVIQLKNDLVPFVTKNGDKIAIAAGKPGQAGVLAQKAVEDDFPGVDMTQVDSNSKDDAALKATTLEDYLLENTNFYGKEISIQVKDAEIVDVINLISEEVGANLVVSDGVTGKVSIKLKKVPWDQALITIMKTRGLGYVRSGSVLRIAPLSALKAESTAANEVQNARKSLTPFHVKVFPLSYASPETLETKLKPFLTVASGSDTRTGKVISEARSSSIIINDTKEVIKNVERLIKELDRPPLQVMIEAKVVEATKEFTREYGSSLFSSINSNNTASNVGVTNGFDWNRPGNFGSPLVNTLNATGLNFFGNLTHILRLNEIERKIKVLSAPKVLAMNNEQSTIVQVTQVLNRTSTINEGGGPPVVTAEPIDVELRLEVKPQITSDSNIIMDLLVKRQFPGNINSDLGATAINTREAKTKVIVGNNRTAVIGGIYQVDNTEEESGIPIVRNIPLIKWLFGNKINRKTDSELMVFVTPRILNRRGKLNPVGKTPVASKETVESFDSF